MENYEPCWHIGCRNNAFYAFKCQNHTNKLLIIILYTMCAVCGIWIRPLCVCVCEAPSHQFVRFFIYLFIFTSFVCVCVFVCEKRETVWLSFSFPIHIYVIAHAHTYFPKGYQKATKEHNGTDQLVDIYKFKSLHLSTICGWVVDWLNVCAYVSEWVSE